MDAQEVCPWWVQKKFLWIMALVAAAVPVFFPFSAAAGVFELSGGFNFNKTTYGDNSYSWTRRYVTSIAYYLTERSSIELAFQDAITRTNILNEEDTTFHDRVYSVDFVQHLTGKDVAVQPYVKGGVGQLNRNATGSYAGGGSPPQEYDSFTTILGLGLKVYLTKNFAIRGEATTYLTGAKLSTWKNNGSATAGVSVFF